jgi:glycosyltransferase involved in cell wall biosynthesis
MDMTRVSVAVPTFNGAEFIEKSLKCLQNQTCEDIEVILADNGSTDGTSDICASFAASDPRFRHERLAETIPVLENFRRAFNLTSSSYFMWRADDDCSSIDYIEKLSAALDINGSANLAVCPIRRISRNGRERMMNLPESGHPSAILAGCHAAWVYGLWRRRAIPEAFQMMDAYPFTWASDHIAMLPFITRGEIALCADTEFHQHLRRQPNYELPPLQRLRARRAYASLAMPLVNDNVSRSDMRKHMERRVAPLGKTYIRLVTSAIGLRR